MPKVSDAHLAARRRQILDAAARCFARDGFHRTSMQDIVRESGISAGLVYRYFAGKDDMIAAIVTEWHDQRRALLGGSPGEQVAAYLAYLRSVGDPAAAETLRLGVQVWAESLRSPRLHDLARRNVDDPRADTAAAIRHLQAAGALDPGLDPDALARILIAVYQGLVLQTAWDETVDNEAYVRTAQTILEALTPTARNE